MGPDFIRPMVEQVLAVVPPHMAPGANLVTRYLSYVRGTGSRSGGGHMAIGADKSAMRADQIGIMP